ncbi:MAG: YIP1 family protein [Calditrichaeota bacterium]|nr:YIP1 family protein [Calditrichota bacterium]
MKIFWNRIVRVLRLEKQVFEEVEADQTALPQALGLVILASFASGIATISGGLDASLFSGTLGSLIGWFVMSYIIYFVGARILPEPQTKADYGQLLRTIGFATAPGLIAVFGIIPFLYTISALVASVWMLIAIVIAVRQALDYTSTGRAIIVSVIGWIIYALLAWVFRVIVH